MPAFTWNPWGNLTIEIESTVVEYIANYIGDLVGGSFKFLLDQLNLSIPIKIPLGAPDWNIGKIDWSFEIAFPDNIKKIIVNNVKNITTDATREFFRLKQYQQAQSIDLLGLILNKILDLFPQELKPDSWRTVLIDGIQKIAPWLTTGSIFSEAGAFLMALAILLNTEKNDKDFSSVSYACWSFAVECENRLEIHELLSPAIKSFFIYIKEDENPNGLWAWLAEETDEVKSQLALFESMDHRYWDKFAYESTKYTKWSKTPADGNKKSPRIDYLVLDGLYEKGPPKKLDLCP
jgi:hypothetical protein